MSDLDAILQQHNPFVQLYQTAYQIMLAKPPEQQRDVQAHIVLQVDADRRCYNLPTVDEVAAVIPGNSEGQVVDQNHDIILQLQGGGLWRINASTT
jgi:hypothetical protein